jgi:hypothetical protein
MSDDPDFEYLIIESTVFRAHQHACGAKKGGLKIRPSAARAVVGAPRSTSPSEVSAARSASSHRRTPRRCPASLPLIEDLPAAAVMADTANDSDQIRQAVADKGAVCTENPIRHRREEQSA